MEFFSEHTELSTERAMSEGRTNSERRESGVIPRKRSKNIFEYHRLAKF